MHDGHMIDAKAQGDFGEPLPEVNTTAYDEHTGNFDFSNWRLVADDRDQAADTHLTSDAQRVIPSRRFSLVKGAGQNNALNLIVHVTDEELTGFRFACAEAARAELELTHPLLGLKHYRAALQHFPFLPGLDSLRDKLIASARHAVEASLQSADDSLKDRRTWTAAQRALEHANALIEAESTLHMEFAARYALLESLFSRVIELTLSGPHKLDPPDEHTLLRDLRDEMASDPESYWHLPGWRSVRECLDRLDRTAQEERQHELRAARRQLLADCHSAYNDASASAFIERYVQAGNSPPHDEDVAQLQLEEVAALLARASQLIHAHGLDAPALLHTEMDKLEAWQRDLRALIAGMSIARHRAELGLREPEQFDVARYVLGVGGRKPATALHQAPHMFVGHPSLLRCKAFVESCAARRRSQEKLRDEIHKCLQFDAVTAVEDIPASGVDGLLTALRSQLQAGTATPIEVAWDKLREMARGEPDDACGLQSTLVYHDSDDYGHEVVSLPVIMAVVGRKVRQIHILRDWLAHVMRFSGGANCEQEKNAIQILRDSGPAGLTEAQARCRAVKSGGNDGSSDGLWSLERMRRALSQDSMLAHLQQRLREGDPDAANMPLCAPARAINQQRHALWFNCEQQLRACDQLGADIASRIERFASAWDEFEHGYRALMGLPSLRRNRAAESAEWLAFQRAAEQFCGICPNYPVFQAKLSDVQARLKLEPECLGGRHA